MLELGFERQLDLDGEKDMMFAAAHTPHGYDQFSQDFSVWVVFYGPQKPAGNR
jgi:hypothetical protein